MFVEILISLTVLAPRRVDEVSVVGREGRVQHAPADVPRPDGLGQGEAAAGGVEDADHLVLARRHELVPVEGVRAAEHLELNK